MAKGSRTGERASQRPLSITGTDGAEDLGFILGQRGTIRALGGDDTLTGNAGDDTLDGGDGADDISDSLFGNLDSGRDVLLGGAGDDTIDSRGADRVDGGDGADLAILDTREFAADLTVSGAFGHGSTATLSNGTVVSNVERVRLSTGAGDDVLTLTESNDFAAAGAGDDQVSGGGGADRLEGQAGNDTLRGGAGDDLLVSGDGADLLIGGAGADLFLFQGLGGLDGTPAARIGDFDVVAGDRVQLDVAIAEALIDAPDPFDGFVRVTDTTDGALFEVDLSGTGGFFRAVAVLDGVTAAELGTGFLIA